MFKVDVTMYVKNACMLKKMLEWMKWLFLCGLQLYSQSRLLAPLENVLVYLDGLFPVYVMS